RRAHRDFTPRRLTDRFDESADELQTIGARFFRVKRHSPDVVAHHNAWIGLAVFNDSDHVGGIVGHGDEGMDEVIEMLVANWTDRALLDRARAVPAHVRRFDA